ncbi:MAG: molybdopterin-binding protein [Chloroflexota bacterium]|nr:molybdopterin-binding protein [Chloroflexota bacterium]
MSRPIRSARILAIGSELTHGWTRDTNSGDLARELTELGIDVEAVLALPDRLAAVRDAFSAGLESADLVVSTGGLGPTPDDLTREAIAAACGLTPAVDSRLEAWLKTLFERRGQAMPEANRKQAWLVPGADALPNAHGTAPGWWLQQPDGRLIVALPGPPREMWPMWRAHALPRLRAREVGAERAWHTLRLTGVGESQLVDLIGEELLRSQNPSVATYARPDAVDVRVGAIAAGAETGQQLVDRTVAELRRRLDRFVFAEGEDGWPEALAARLGGRSLAVAEVGTGGQLLALLGGSSFVVRGELLRTRRTVAELAEEARRSAAADVGMAVRATEREVETRVEVAIASASGTLAQERSAFLGGAEGRRRAAIAACAALWQRLKAGP